METELITEDYASFVRELKERIRNAQVRAALNVNRELVLLYWQIGREILTRQQSAGWGAKIIEQLSRDLRREFPEMKGFSPRNLKYMRAFAEAWPEEPFVQQVAAQIPWFHNCVLLDKVTSPAVREWYIRQTIENGWSRNVLVHQIDSRLFERQGKAVTNFAATLPAAQSELAQQVLKDPYNFDFLSLDKEAPFSVGFQSYAEGRFAPLVRLRGQKTALRTALLCPRRWTNGVCALQRRNSFPRIILCKTENKVVAEYALRDMSKPIGVSVYQALENLPEHLQGQLPTVEALEAELNGYN